MRDWEEYNVFAVLSPSTAKELDDLRKESLKEAKMLLRKAGQFKATRLLKALTSDLHIRKLLSDMYVWQRIHAITIGIDEALTPSTKKFIQKRELKCPREIVLILSALNRPEKP